MNRNIYTIGETVYDVLFEDGKIITGKAGGSMLNTAVSLGRMGTNVHFISELGQDKLGDIVIDFLNKNHVNTSFIHRLPNGQTPVALAFLDVRKNAKYSFYKAYPAQRLTQPMPTIHKNDIVLFGSFFAVSPDVHDKVFEFVSFARQAGAIIIYDPNIRHPKDHGVDEIKKLVRRCMANADVVRASHEDFKVLFSIDSPEDAATLVLDESDAALIYTHSSEFIFVRSGEFSAKFPVPDIEMVSTVGAGDNFNAGIIYALIRNQLSRENLINIPLKDWTKIVSSGIQFSQAVCRSLENYIPAGFAFHD